MISNMPCYELMKDSGVEWLGEIPIGWEVRKIKYLFKIGRGRVISQQELDELAVYPVYSSQTQDNGVLGYIHSYDFDCKQITWTTDGANAGTIFLRDGKYSCTNVCGTLKPLSEKFSLAFCEKSLSVAAQYYKRPDTNGAKIMNGEMAEIYITFPSLSEQTAIATFLDQKTAQIEQAIALKQKQIELFKERKQLVIQHAVTKGLNPHAPMRDSGVEWIGEIPEHWIVKRLRVLGTTQNGISAGAEYFGTGFPFVSYGDVYNNRELPEEVKGLAMSPIEDRKQYSIQAGDILFTRTSETIQEIGFTSVCMKTIDNATFSGFLIRFRPAKNLIFKGFSKYYFSAAMHRSYFVKEMNLVTRASLSQELLKNLPVILPPLNEQEQIYSFIETQSAKIDKAIDIQQQQINKLKEYKATLINSAVTGKIKVF